MDSIARDNLVGMGSGKNGRRVFWSQNESIDNSFQELCCWKRKEEKWAVAGWESIVRKETFFLYFIVLKKKNF